MGKIVVGIDGSEASQAALHWAAHEANLRGVELDVVVVWRIPVYTGPGFDVSWVDPDAMAAGATAVADAALDSVRDEVGGVAARSVLLRGHTGRRLVEQAADADLLVIGSRGLGGFTGALAGSVSSYCVHHNSACPTVVVPSEHHDIEGDRPDD